ncbi:hypothetical protein BDW22DRAFT_1404488 [Trametopsis cervina]|nr:hypothetical protein BDW22DRAFT_1404488 [Trametopsis cervina]
MFFRAIPLILASAVAVQAAIHDITVGDSNGDTIFAPEAIFADPGDQVVFHFQQKNHSVSQTSFAQPCNLKDGGFDSGFHPVPANQTDNFPTFTVTVNDTTPVWVTCLQGANTAASHCGKGMVFSINCPPDGSPNSFANFKAAALAIGASLQAGASASSAAAYPPATPAPTATEAWTTADYGTVTIPAAPSVSTVTVTVTVAQSIWTTTYGSYPGSPDPTPASLEGTVHKVTVGANGALAYDPPFVMAQPRDIIQFEFHQKNHTSTKSSFAAPCLPALAADGTPSLDSGFMPVGANDTVFPTWNVTVNDTTPIWFYCKQTGHCGKGMVFAINPVQDSLRNFSAFQALAQTLNGTNATGSASAPNTSSSSTPNGQNSGAGSIAINAAIGLGSIFAAVALAL